MSSRLLEPPRWSPRQWRVGILAAVATQVALLLHFGQRPPVLQPPTLFGARILSASDPWSARQLADLLTMRDPTLFALPSSAGFSRSAWLEFTAQEHQLRAWTAPPCWLPLRTEWLGDSFAALAATNRTAPSLIADKPLPRPTGLDVPVPNQAVASQSHFRVEGALAGRVLRSRPELRTWPHDELLSNTVVHVMVDPEGYVRTTTLLTESGSSEADWCALRQSATTRFEPVARGTEAASLHPGFTWGQFVFQWATLPRDATNGTAAEP